MATLAFNREEIAPRELRPEVLELDGISRESVEAHHKLYVGYINKRNEILAKLDDVDLSASNQIYSELRALKVDLTFAVGGVKNHEVLLRAPGRWRWRPERVDGRCDLARLRQPVGLARRPARDGNGGRGWAWTAYDWDEERLFNFIGDAQNTFPVWNATPLVALDVYEHAYFLDYGTDRPGYIEAFFANLDWEVINSWAEQYGITL